MMEMVKNELVQSAFKTSVKFDWMSVLQLQILKAYILRENIVNAWVFVQYSIYFVRFAKYFGARLGK